MLRKIFIILVALGLAVMCVILMSRDSDSLGNEVEQKDKREKNRGDYVRFVDTNTNTDVRSKRRNSQTKVK